MKLLTKWFISALSLLGADYLIEGISVDSFATALIIALFLGFVNAVFRPILVFLTLPITMVTLGLFIFVLNGVLFYLLSVFIAGFNITSLGAAILGALTVSVFSWIGNRLFVGSKKKRYVNSNNNTSRVNINEENVKVYDQED